MNRFFNKTPLISHSEEIHSPLKYSVQLFVVAVLFIMAAVAHGSEKAVNIIYTGSLQGQLEPCGCSPQSDFGGMARIGGWLEEHRNELKPYILVDAGNFAGEDRPQGRLKTEAMLQSFSSIHYDAIALSDRELALPEEYFFPLLQKYTVPIIATLPDYTRSISVTRDSFNITVNTDPAGPLDGSINILLTALTVNEAKHLKGWDIIISAANEEIEEPLKENGTLILSAYPKGKKLGILTIQKTEKGTLTYSHRWQAVGNDLKEKDSVRSVLDDYDRKVAQLMKDRAIPLAGTTFAGAEKCAECHQPFYEQWKNTRHADALASLEEAGKASDPECIVCHVLGLGQEGGFFSRATTPKLANVQCESCHGLNRDHLNDFSPMQPVHEQICKGCHTKENSPEFDYPVYLKKIKH